METEITLFGQLAEKTGTHRMILQNAEDTDTILTELGKRYPALAESPVIVAVNRRTVTENTPIRQGDSVALMPPFSGG